ncbi:MAG TPA: hypothetical protein VHL14_02065 [Steroidobacteraceae bacterium]|jgi:hypothetical protein|nr:hypothetical protein [Steroidobacteraceae bacterium]
MSQATPDMQMDIANLYREDSYTDRKLGVIRCMTPVTGTGETDTTRPVLYLGQAEIMTSMGPVPINFEIEAKTLGEAVAGFAEAAQAGIQRTVEQINEMRRQQASQLVVAPGNMPGLKGDPRGGGGKIQIP